MQFATHFLNYHSVLVHNSGRRVLLVPFVIEERGLFSIKWLTKVTRLVSGRARMRTWALPTAMLAAPREWISICGREPRTWDSCRAELEPRQLREWSKETAGGESQLPATRLPGSVEGKWLLSSKWPPGRCWGSTRETPGLRDSPPLMSGLSSFLSPPFQFCQRAIKPLAPNCLRRLPLSFGPGPRSPPPRVAANEASPN